jgi:hypothetical protein
MRSIRIAICTLVLCVAPASITQAAPLTLTLSVDLTYSNGVLFDSPVASIAFDLTPGLFPRNFDSATLRFPLGGDPADETVVPFDFDSSDGSFHFRSGLYDSLADLNGDFGFGLYGALAHTPDPFFDGTSESCGGRLATDVFDYGRCIAYFGNKFPLQVPKVGFVDDPDGMNPALAMLAGFGGFSFQAGGWEQHSLFRIFDTGNTLVYDSGPLASFSGHLLTIPGDTLLPDTAYVYELDFVNRVPGSTGFDNDQLFTAKAVGRFVTGERSVTPVPEPSSLLMMMTAGVGLLYRRRGGR